MRKTKQIALQALALALGLSMGFSAYADDDEALRALMTIDKPAIPAKDKISPVRASILSQTASTVGLQTGLWQGAKEIRQMLKDKDARLDKSFRFGDLVMGEGVLPPVVTCTDNAEAIEANVKRVASRVCKIEEPARFFSGAPSWEDYLFLGLPDEKSKPTAIESEQLLPRDSAERAYWQEEVKKAYREGQDQAMDIFLDNLAQLERTYLGMRTFYELYQRKMVTKPVVAKSQEVSSQDDPDTLVLGDTLVRITVDSNFINDPSQWKALLSRPSDNKGRLPYTGEFDPEQVAHAMEVAKSLGAWRKELVQAKEEKAKEQPKIPAVAKKKNPAPVKNPSTKAIPVPSKNPTNESELEVKPSDAVKVKESTKASAKVTPSVDTGKASKAPALDIPSTSDKASSAIEASIKNVSEDSAYKVQDDKPIFGSKDSGSSVSADISKPLFGLGS